MSFWFKLPKYNAPYGAFFLISKGVIMVKHVMRRGWIVDLDDGTQMWEDTYNWSEVPKSRIKKLSLIFEGRVWSITDVPAYIQRKRGSASPGETSATVEKRIIGYYDDDGFKVEYIVDERTGIMNMEVTEV